MRLLNRMMTIRRAAAVALALVLAAALAAVWRTDMSTKNVSMTIDSRNNC